MKKDLKNLFKRLIKKTLSRLKLLFLISITIISLIGGVWFGINAIIGSGIDILIFAWSCVGVWFGVGMIDMFNEKRYF